MSSEHQARQERCSLRESAHIHRRRLVFSEGGTSATSASVTVHTQTWSEDEIKALLEFLLFHGEAGAWPCHKRDAFWKGAASYVKICSKSSHERTGKHSVLIFFCHCSPLFCHSGNACRYKVVSWFKERFQCPTDAEAYYFGRSASSAGGVDQQLSTLSGSFSKCCSSLGVEVPSDFVELSAKAMVHLKESKRSNVLYSLAKGLGTLRCDNSDTRFPMKRMPLGLLEYMVNFFEAEEMREVDTIVRYILYYKFNFNYL